ncbi:MAG: hypothetical protein AMJ67_02395 [Betaproteobacteria bacterium SG8_41]|nr:MAG: hypothetical protein AMJ67_02395 [Betaproteobacteria bacterium SG8_41]
MQDVHDPLAGALLHVTNCGDRSSWNADIHRACGVDPKRSLVHVHDVGAQSELSRRAFDGQPRSAGIFAAAWR